MSNMQHVPGTVATVVCNGQQRRAILNDRDGALTWFFDKPVGARMGAGPAYIADVRPLAVLDPEDGMAVAHLLDSARSFLAEKGSGADILDRISNNSSAMQDALRALAKPPKPEEPTDPAVRVWAAGTTWAKIASWWVPVAQDETVREWDWLIERDDFRVIS